MAKKIQVEDLEQVIGGVVQPVVQRVVDGSKYSFFCNTCKKTFSVSTNKATDCPHCGSSNVTPQQ